MTKSITKKQARRFILLKQGLLGDYKFSGKESVLAFVEQAGCVQFDPIDICGRTPELVLLSRVKDYKKKYLEELLYKDRLLIDHFDKQLAIVKTDDWPRLVRYRNYYGEQVRSKAEIENVAEDILAVILEKGPVCSADLDIEGRVDWYWQHSRLSRAALEAMYFRGDLVVHRKKGTVKYYDLADRHIPPHLLSSADPHSEEDAFFRWQLLRRIGAVGLLWNRASDAFLNIDGMKTAARNAAFEWLESEGKITQVAVEDIDYPFYFLTEDLPLLEKVTGDEAFRARTEFIAPLDSFIWDRRMIKALFDFDYTWEIYTPQAKRKYGYYVLPILFGERLVGRIEPAADRKRGVLVVKGLWLEDGVRLTKKLLASVERALKRLAKLNGCKTVEGDLAAFVL